MQRRSGLHEMGLPPPTPSSQESESPEREPEEEVIQSIEDTLDNVRDDIYQDASLGCFPDAREKELFYNEAPHSLSGKNPKLCLRSLPSTQTHMHFESKWHSLQKSTLSESFIDFGVYWTCVIDFFLLKGPKSKK